MAEQNVPQSDIRPPDLNTLPPEWRQFFATQLARLRDLEKRVDALEAP